MTLSDDAEYELKRIAELTDGFTGADLQAFLYNAQLLAMKEKLIHATKDKQKSTSDATFKEIKYQFDWERQNWKDICLKSEDIGNVSFFPNIQ